MAFDQFFNGDPIVLQGSVLKKDEDKIFIQLHPGLVVEIKEHNAQCVEEATDPLTGRAFVRVTLKPDAEITAEFQPRLARLALTHDAKGVPFSLGGNLPGHHEGPVSVAVTSLQPGPRGPSLGLGYGTIGEFHTRSNVLFWGWINDDKTYTD